ncbi:MAG: TRAP transporter small permease [Planctomycetota bacterium]|jgi:TRAP-type C4-dicarboxylate transport system permease small subunit|nr:TRAP transporter small permease [Planctomycetota bacterium]
MVVERKFLTLASVPTGLAAKGARMVILRKIIDFGMRVQSILGALCLIAIVVVISSGVVLRYVFNSPWAWTEEIITFVFIWLSFAGAGVVAAKRHHIVVDFITGMFSRRMRFLVQLVSNLLIMSLLAVMSVSTAAVMPSLKHGTVALGIPRYFYNLPILIVSLYILLVYVEDMVALFRGDADNGSRLEPQKEAES